jgi:hypothetical protein
VVDGLATAHVMASAGASVAVVLLTERWPLRLVAWAAVLVAGGVTFLVGFGAVMNVTGWYP